MHVLSRPLILDRLTADAAMKFPAKAPISIRVSKTMLLWSVSIWEETETVHRSKSSEEEYVTAAKILSISPFLAQGLDDDEEDEEEEVDFLNLDWVSDLVEGMEDVPLAFKTIPFADWMKVIFPKL